MMELRWKNEETKAIALAFVNDEDARVLEAVGYYHCNEEDCNDEYLGTPLEVWKPCEQLKRRD